MTEAPYFDDEAADDLLLDNAGAMARRQFGVSLVVGFLLLAVAAGCLARTPVVAPDAGATVAHRIISHPEPIRVEFAQPASRADRV